MQTVTAMKPMEFSRTKILDQASRGYRLLATLIDGLVAIGVFLIYFFSGNPVAALVGFAGLIIYQIYALTVSGQTIGKKVMGIKIVKYDSNDNGGFVTNVLLRTVLNALIGIVPLYTLIDILFIFRQDHRCIHDLLAKTRVVCC
jgi:uncharacterized RDD family membrane protein YckC